VNSLNKVLRIILNIDTKEGYNSGRFRDIWLDDSGKKIVLYTRNGGGNRDCYCRTYQKGGENEEPLDHNYDPKEAFMKVKHDDDCLWPVNEKLKTHPNYIKDYDDDFDCTDAYFEFTIPDKYKSLIKELLNTQGKYTNPAEKWSALETEMKSLTKEQMETDPRFTPFIELFQKIIKCNK